MNIDKIDETLKNCNICGMDLDDPDHSWINGYCVNMLPVKEQVFIEQFNWEPRFKAELFNKEHGNPIYMVCNSSTFHTIDCKCKS